MSSQGQNNAHIPQRGEEQGRGTCLTERAVVLTRGPQFVVVNFIDELAGLVNLVGELAVHVVVDGLICLVKLSLMRVELAGG